MYKFAKLDLFMIKPYLKKMLLILIVISIPMIISTENIYITSFLSVFYGIIMVSYPFVLSEKNNIDNFYGTLSVNKKSIVNGRYMFALMMILMFSAISAICMVIGSITLKQNFEVNEAIFMLSVALFIAIILISIQLPVYFKFGYTKAKLFTYIPFIIMGIGVPLIIKVIGDDAQNSLKVFGTYIENNGITVSIIIVLVSLVIFEISNVISQKLY